MYEYAKLRSQQYYSYSEGYTDQWSLYYNNSEIKIGEEDEDLVSVLNFLGRDSWELAAMVSTNQYILKRKVQ